MVESTAASEPAILAGVEQWARLCGFVMHSRTGYDRQWTDKRWGIHVNPLPPKGSLLISPDGDELRGVEVSPATALAWALLVETEAESVDVGRCPACAKRGGPMEWSHGGAWVGGPDRIDGDVAKSYVGSGWSTSWVLLSEPLICGETHRLLLARPCPACNGTGREHIPAARLLLDVASGDTTARDMLLVHANYLQTKADPRGDLLMWALCLWAVPARVSDCAGASPSDPDLRLAHTAEALRWLERLTAQHELVRNRNAPVNTYTVTVGGHEYTVDAHSMTASEIAAALNAQGGPATFSANADGSSVVTTIRNGATSSTLIVASVLREADLSVLPQVPDEPSRRQHASHIGSRLGRRLGVRR